MLEQGLRESASYTPKRLLSPTLKVTRVNSAETDDFLEVHYENDELTKSSTHAHGSFSLTKDLNANSGISRGSSSPVVKPVDITDSINDTNSVDIDKITHVERIQRTVEVITTQPTRTRVRSEPQSDITTKMKSLNVASASRRRGGGGARL